MSPVDQCGRVLPGEHGVAILGRTEMASWIMQTLRVTESTDVSLESNGVSIYWFYPEGSYHIDFYPCCREEANHMSIALKLAAKRLEEVGKGLKS